jgi:purine-binding chemotaxis protein CheW
MPNPFSTKDKDLLKQRAHKLAQPPSGKERQHELSVIVFYLNKETYAIEYKYIKEVYKFKEFAFIPHLPPFVKGVINVRRKILSIIDLKEFFGLSNENQEIESKVIILEGSNREFAILTDGIEGMQTVTLEEIQPTLSTLTGVKQEFLKGLTTDRLIILDGQRLLEDARLVIQ